MRTDERAALEATAGFGAPANNSMQRTALRAAADAERWVESSLIHYLYRSGTSLILIRNST